MSSRTIIDLTNFYENLSGDHSRFYREQEALKFIIRCISKCNTTFLIVATHDSQPLSMTLKNMFTDVGIPFFNTNDYFDFGKLLEPDSILISRDKVFYQFLKRWPLIAKIKHFYQAGESQIFTSDFLDERYGFFPREDWYLYTLTMESKRLGYQRLKSSLVQAYKFNMKIYTDNASHRFWQTAESTERSNKMIINYQKSNLSIPPIFDIDVDKLMKYIDEYFPLLQRMAIRAMNIVKQRKMAINRIRKIKK